MRHAICEQKKDKPAKLNNLIRRLLHIDSGEARSELLHFTHTQENILKNSPKYCFEILKNSPKIGATLKEKNLLPQGANSFLY